MIDGHIHIEAGAYTKEWIDEFVDRAMEMNLDEIWLLEHSYLFDEYVPMYDSVRTHSNYIIKWFQRRAGIKDLDEFLRLADEVRKKDYPIKIKFGLEVCYFEDSEDFIYDIAKNKELDFWLGSVHYADRFAYDHIVDLWENEDVDKVYKDFFERSINLAKSGLFSGLAHPDCVKLFGHKPSFPLDDYYEKLAKALSMSKMYAEENSGIARRCPQTASLGMHEDLIKALKRYKVKIITASDAHSPKDVGDKIELMERKLDSIFI